MKKLYALIMAVAVAMIFTACSSNEKILEENTDSKYLITENISPEIFQNVKIKNIIDIEKQKLKQNNFDNIKINEMINDLKPKAYKDLIKIYYSLNGKTY